jgi:hypothetical protein
VDLSTDPLNCGTSGNTCADAEICLAGICVPILRRMRRAWF